MAGFAGRAEDPVGACDRASASSAHGRLRTGADGPGRDAVHATRTRLCALPSKYGLHCPGDVADSRAADTETRQATSRAQHAGTARSGRTVAHPDAAPAGDGRVAGPVVLARSA